MKNIKVSIDENRNFTCEGEEKAVSSFLKNNNINLHNYINSESKNSIKLNGFILSIKSNGFILSLVLIGLFFIIFNVIFLVRDINEICCKVLRLITIIFIIIGTAMVHHKWNNWKMTLFVAISTSLILSVCSGYLNVPEKIELTEPEVKEAIKQQIPKKN